MSASVPPDVLVNDDSPEYWLSILGDAQPLYATLPTPGAPNELAQVELVAKQLKTPLLPWQRYVVRVMTEKNPDGSYKYPNALLTVPRQSGKTTVIRALLATRALINKDRKAFLTAQTGRDARERLFELSEQIERSVFGKTISVRRAADSPGITFHTKSRIGCFSPTPESLHGYNFSDCLLDEIFAFDDVEGNNLLGAIMPAMQTKKDRQLILVSTKGTPLSTFLNGWIKRGKESLEDPEAQIAYFEWSLTEGLDAFDPENWNFHPGMGGGLIKSDDILAASKAMSKGEFTRAFMNRQTETLESVLDLAKWNDLKSALRTPKRNEVAIGWEVSMDRSKAAVVAAWKDGKTTQVKVLRCDAGTNWLAPLLIELQASHPLAIGADKYAQNNVIADELLMEIPDFKLTLLKPEGIKTGSVAFKARIEDGTIQHEGHLGMRTAIATAQSRPFGEGWSFSHKSEPELMAAVVACRLLDEVRAEVQPLFISFDD